MKIEAGFLDTVSQGIRAFRKLVQTEGGKKRATRYRNLVAYALSYKSTDASIKSMDAHLDSLRTQLPSAAQTLQNQYAPIRKALSRVKKMYFDKVHSMIDKHSVTEYNQIRKLMGLPGVNVGLVGTLRSKVARVPTNVRKKLAKTEAT